MTEAHTSKQLLFVSVFQLSPEGHTPIKEGIELILRGADDAEFLVRSGRH